MGGYISRSNYTTAVNTAGIQNAGTAISNEWNNDTAFNNNLDTQKRFAVRQAQNTYGMNADPSVINDATDKVEHQAYTARTLAWANNDPVGAYKWMQQNESHFDPNEYHMLLGDTKSKADEAAVAQVSNSTNYTPGARTNNVGNIRVSNAAWDGKGTPQGGFETFDTPENGVKATVQNLQSYAQQNGGKITLQDAINKWAPASDNNNPTSYAASVAKQTGIAVDASLPLNDPNQMAQVVKAMTGIEHGAVPFSDAVFQRGAAAAINGTTPVGTPQRNPDAFSQEQSAIADARAKAQAAFPDRPDLQQKVVANKWQQIQEANTLQAKYDAQQQKQLQDNQEAARNKIVTTLQLHPEQFDIKDIANNPYLNASQKEQLWRVAQEHFGTQGDHDVKTYGPGFYTAFQMVNAPEGDPNRITDPTQLLKHVGANGDLTLAGYEKLTSQIQGKRTPEGEANSAMLGSFMKSVKSQLTLSNDYMTDPKGDTAFLKFQAAAFPLIEANQEVR